MVAVASQTSHLVLVRHAWCANRVHGEKKWRFACADGLIVVYCETARIDVSVILGVGSNKCRRCLIV